MKKIFRLFMWGFGVLLVLALVAIAAFALLFDPNALRDDITRLVEKKTGRQMTIEGDLALSYFPWLGFEAGRTTITNPEGFSDPVMASFESASASVKLMPLLSRRMELSQVTLDGVQMDLEVRADGSNNWSDLQSLRGQDTADDPDAGGAGFSTQGVGGIRLTNTQVGYSDAETGNSYSISNLDLKTGPLVPGTAFTLAASGDVVSTAHEIAGPAKLNGEVQINEDGVVHIAEPRIGITATGKGVPGDELTVNLEAPALEFFETTVSIDTPSLHLSGTGPGEPYATFEVQLESASLKLDENTLAIATPALVVSGTGTSEAWSAINAKIDGQSLNVVDFDRIDLPALQVSGSIAGSELPDGKVDLTLSGERLQGSLEHQNIAIDAVRANMLDLSVFSKKIKASKIIDAPVIEAPIDVSEFSPLKLLAKLGYDEIVTADPTALSSTKFSANARYGPDSMSLKNLRGTVDQTTVNGSARIMQSGEIRFALAADNINLDRYRAPAEEPLAEGEAVGVADIEIPAEQLKALQLNGTLKIAAMELVGLKSTNVDVGIKAAGGNIRVNPASAALYGGTYKGDIRLDATGAKPTLSLNERLDGVQFGPFVEDLLGNTRLSGALTGRITVTGSGHTSNEITATSNGDAVFKFADGAYEGVDVWHKVRTARALIKREPPPSEPAQGRTRFADLSGTAAINDGVMTSNDINMVLPFMKVRGKGSMALLSQEIDFHFLGDVVDRPELDAGVDELVGFTIPIKITGTLAAPDVGVDMGGLVAELAKRKLLDKLGLGGESDSTDPDAAAESPEEALEEKEEEIKDELEDKLKDKLKDIFGGG